LRSASAVQKRARIPAQGPHFVLCGHLCSTGSSRNLFLYSQALLTLNVFYEEEGTFKVGSVLADNTTSLHVEAPHGKRAKIKAASVLLRFDAPSLSEFMDVAQKTAEDLDPNFLWECCESEAEFASDTLAADYFGHTATPEEAAAVLIRLHSAPMYFYKKGRGRYKAAPPKALEAALASQEKKRRQAEQQARYIELLEKFTLPEEFKPALFNLLYRPDKNTVEWKALETACASTKLSVSQLLEKCGAIPSTHDYHLNRFLLEHFPAGTGFGSVDAGELLHLSSLIKPGCRASARCWNVAARLGERPPREPPPRPRSLPLARATRAPAPPERRLPCDG